MAQQLNSMNIPPPPYLILPTIHHDSDGLLVEHGGRKLLLKTNAYIDRSSMGAHTSVYANGSLIWVSSYHYHLSEVSLEEYEVAQAVEGEPLSASREFYEEGWSTINEYVKPRGTEGDEEDMFCGLYQYLQ